jgi:putative SOS response-associated peptidase YedK
MCGRFIQKTPLGEIRVLFETTGPVPNAPANYNAAPTQDVAVVRFNPKTRERALGLLRWGLVPLWAKDKSIGPKCINARAESITAKPAFSDAFARRRCLIPTEGFYEWRKVGASRVPYAAVAADGEPIAFAGVWERWKDPADGGIVRSFAIVTTTANDVCRPIHDRMPVILRPQDWSLWLGERDDEPDQALALCRPFPSAAMRVYPVDPRVGNYRNNDAALLEPASLAAGG